MKLPDKFLEKYENILGDEYADFLASFDEEAVTAFRINPLKKLADNSFDSFVKIENESFGYYGKISGKSAEHVAGMVYSQEPAAQIVGEVAVPKPGMKVLDLCAAPGGKSTHLLSFLGNEGLLVSNEISHKRSKILTENIERFGAKNVVVLNESPAHLAKVFPRYFDMIVLDAPCSGEGMFRKDPSAVQYWSADYPEKCAQLQREIIAEALKMLAPAGQLIYSTCTWSPEENENNVSWILENYPDLQLVNIPKTNGLSSGLNMPEVIRCWPHKFRGEGQFVAKFIDKNEEIIFDTSVKKNDNKKSKKQGKNKFDSTSKSQLTSEQMRLWQEFSKKNLLTDLSKGKLQVFGEALYLLPIDLPDLSTLKIARNGLHLGTFKKNRFEPSFALGLTLSTEEVRNSLEIDEEQFKKYVAGEEIKTDKNINNGWVQLAIKNNGIGFAKVTDRTVKNYFPKGLRFFS
ncbi:RsmF rRNA methyltransferase first C-terminal domain-containing protein [Lactococcus nasutitermitis]|uniref:RsmF rRNA methyltransferase first C-terminal domain-containing protein n=1 Tax=Lactococcus nasutitermitis TaxID=1652957 RepID=A0ABV9JDH0_9LACT|nr:RsmB/NOP family class I SAM-dependent RNA methyltransferase [Lactococcus nasutitermitis]